MTDGSWQPELQQLKQLAQCLNDSLDGRNQVAQKNAEQVRCYPYPSHARPKARFLFDADERLDIDACARNPVS